VDELNIRLLKAVQDRLRLTRRPYQALGKEMSMSENEVIYRLTSLTEGGVIRRFAATIGHLPWG
jgi:DNA-binding Lrp family transcriptional regulator